MCAAERYDYREEDLVAALRKAGVSKGDSVFVHSNLGFFGRLQGAREKEDYYRIFKKAIFEVLGGEEKGTLVVPTFSYSFCNKQRFDSKSTPSVCGFFSESVRRDPSALRSEDANFSVAAIGRYAENFTSAAPEHSFGRGSFWERFIEKDGKICNFNFDSGSTLIHYVEKLLGVPYRHDKAFPGKAVVDGVEQDRVFYHFVYDLEKPTNGPDFTKFDRLAKASGAARTAPLGKGVVLVIAARDTLELIRKEIVRNPALLIKGEAVV